MIEILESRIAPASIIAIVNKGGSATLKVLGNTDTVENLSVAFSGDGTVTIMGNGGETFRVNGVDGAGPAQLTGVTKDFSVDLGKNDDVLTMTGVLISGKLTVKMGEGANQTTITGATVGGAASYSGGKGSDTLTTDGAALLVGGGLTLTMGAGTNNVEIKSTEFSTGGNLLYSGGNDADTLKFSSTHANIAGSLTLLGAGNANSLLFQGETLRIGKSVLFLSGKNLSVDSGGVGISATGAMHIGGSFTYIYPHGQQVFGINGSTVEIGGATFINVDPSNAALLAIIGNTVSTGKVTVAATGGVASFALNGGSLNIGGAVMMRGLKDIQMIGAGNISGGVTLSAVTGLLLGGGVGPLTLGGALAYKSNGSVDSTSTIAGVVVSGAVQLSLRAGKDTVNIESSTFMKSFTLDGGPGEDTIRIESMVQPGATIFAGPVFINLGAGNDILSTGSPMPNDKVTALQKFIVTGGPGDTVSLLNGSNVFVVPPVVT